MNRDRIADSTKLSIMSDSDDIVLPSAEPGPRADSGASIMQQEIQSQPLNMVSDTGNIGNGLTSSASRPAKPERKTRARSSVVVQSAATDDHYYIHMPHSEEPTASKRRKRQSKVRQGTRSQN